MITIFVYFITLFLMSYVLHQWYIKLAQKSGIVDIPVSRSSHHKIKPRGGGIVFISLWLITVILLHLSGYLALNYVYYFVPSIAIVCAIGFIDDVKSLNPLVRFCTQFLAAGIALYVFRSSQVTFLSLTIPISYVIFSILLLFGMVWSSNLFNFMDGTDAIAGIESIFIFGASALMFYLSGELVLAWLNLATVAILLGFLCWNWPNSKLFMGDAGSAALGLMIAQMSLVAGIHHIDILPWFILYSAFLFDATVTLCRRIFLNEKWYMPHRKHAYQRLQLMGYDHKQIAYRFVFLNLQLTSMAFWAFSFPKQARFVLLLALLLLTVVYLYIEKHAPFVTFEKDFT